MRGILHELFALEKMFGHFFVVAVFLGVDGEAFALREYLIQRVDAIGGLATLFVGKVDRQ